MSKMPAIYIPHGGGPSFFMEWNPVDAWDVQAAYLRAIPKGLVKKPSALLVISAHWEENIFTVQNNDNPDLLFDYGGFPPHTYQLTYPAKGCSALSMRITALLMAAGIPVKEDRQRGFDHGVFIPLKVAFPDADIPIVQLSLRADLDPTAHIAVGKALQALRDDDVLIIGSGNSFHNMGVFMRSMKNGNNGSVSGREFDNWLSEAICVVNPDLRNQKLIEWALAPGALHAHPREEHLLPLHVVAGAAGQDIGIKTLEDQVMGAVISAFQFG